ncbi:MAG: VWA domain-containing protein [Acidimicrobiales bacterium]
MTFLSGWWLWLFAVLAALAVAYVRVQGSRGRYAARWGSADLVHRVASRRAGWWRHVPAAVLLVALSSAVLAVARPARAVQVPRERATIMLAIDVSSSMEAEDVGPSRIIAAKAAAESFVDLIPEPLNVGLLSFSGVVSVLVPPTTDHIALKNAIATLTLGPRTAIGEAIFASMAAIKTVPTAGGQAPPPARIVLLSDGETTTGRSNVDAARAAADARIQVYTIAFGTDEGFVEREGRRMEVPVNEGALREIADLTGGQAYEAGSAKQLNHVYDDIGHSVGYVTERREVTAAFAGIGLLAGLAAAAGAVGWFSRLP